MTDTRKRAAIYIRASSPEERTGLQFAEFAYIANRAGWHLAAHYKDIDDPGAQTGGERPQFDRMLRDAAQHKFDVLMTWSIERLGHSLQDLVTTLVQLQNAGVDLYLKEQAIDTTTAPGRALFQMAGIFAEAERAMRRERLRTGIARARQSGKRFGRPKIDSGRAGAIRASLASGLSIRKAAKRHGVGVSTVQRLKKAASGPASSDASERTPILTGGPIAAKPVADIAAHSAP